MIVGARRKWARIAATLDELQAAGLIIGWEAKVTPDGHVWRVVAKHRTASYSTGKIGAFLDGIAVAASTDAA